MSSAAAVHNARFMNPSFETRPRTFTSGQHLVAAEESASFANKGTDSDLVGRAFGPEPNIDFRHHLSEQMNVDSIGCQKLRIPRMWSHHRPWGNNLQPSWTISTVHWATKIYLRVYKILEILIRLLASGSTCPPQSGTFLKSHWETETISSSLGSASRVSWNGQFTSQLQFVRCCAHFTDLTTIPGWQLKRHGPNNRLLHVSLLGCGAAHWVRILLA